MKIFFGVRQETVRQTGASVANPAPRHLTHYSALMRIPATGFTLVNFHEHGCIRPLRKFYTWSKTFYPKSNEHRTPDERTNLEAGSRRDDDDETCVNRKENTGLTLSSKLIECDISQEKN